MKLVVIFSYCDSLPVLVIISIQAWTDTVENSGSILLRVGLGVKEGKPRRIVKRIIAGDYSTLNEENGLNHTIGCLRNANFNTSRKASDRSIAWLDRIYGT